MEVELGQFREVFLEEAQEHLENAESALLMLEDNLQDVDGLNLIFRAIHSLKGSSGTFGFDEIARLAHELEELLECIRSGGLQVQLEHVDLLLRGRDYLQAFVNHAHGDDEPDSKMVDAVIQEVRAYLGTGGSEQSSGDGSEAASGSPRNWLISWSAPDWMCSRGYDPEKIFEELEELGDLKIKASASRLEAFFELQPEEIQLDWELSLHTSVSKSELNEVFEFVSDEGALSIELQPASDSPSAGDEADEDEGFGLFELEDEGVDGVAETKSAKPKKNKKFENKENSTIRVVTSKIDRLINLVGELVITQSMLSEIADDFQMEDLPSLESRIEELERNTREIHERVMSVRMLPIGSVLGRFRRMVRDQAQGLGKNIDLQISGEETEIDKSVIESLADPVTHLIRNSVDHGLESPDERVAAGKPKMGTIKLDACHEGGSILIRISDDGRGLDRNKILEKATKNGIYHGEPIEDRDVWQFIFEAGLSTANAVSDLSGRGVGMDVVRRNIQALGGSISIDTELGQGTCITLRLPLTVAIIDGLTLKVNDEVFIAPITSIVEFFKPDADRMQDILGKTQCVKVRGEHLGVIHLGKAFGLGQVDDDCTKGLLAVVEANGKKSCVLVDELLGQQQVVVKSLEKNFRKVNGLSGATVLGDGSVALILDIPGLLEMA